MRLTRWLDIAALLTLLILAALPRLIWMDVSEFHQDEAILSLAARDFVATGQPPLTGTPSSVGIPNPPLSIYLAAIPYRLSPDPLFATSFVALLNVAGVGLLWAIVRRGFGPYGQAAALIAGLIYAFSPWAALYSRKIWAQDMQTPFLLLALYVGMRGFLAGKRWAQVAFLPLFALAMQFHFTAWPLIPLALWVVLSGRKRIHWPSLLVGVVLAALTLVPFLVGLSQSLQADPNRVSNALQREQPVTLSAEALGQAARLATGYGLEELLGPQSIILLTYSPQTEIWALLGLFALVGLVGAVRLGGWRVGGMVILWVVLPILAFTPTWTPFATHYFIPIIPALCFLSAAGIVWLATVALRPVSILWQPQDPARYRRPYAALFLSSAYMALAGVLASIPISQGLWWRDFLTFVNTSATPGYNTPLHYHAEVAQRIAGFDDVVIISNAVEAQKSADAAIMSVVLARPPRCVRALAGGDTLLFPRSERLVTVFGPGASTDPLYQYYQVNNSITIPLRPGEGIYRLFYMAFKVDWPDAPEIRTIKPVRFANGAQLTGYRFVDDRLYLDWRLPGAVREDYYYAAQFLNARNEKTGQTDRLLWPGRYWCEGDRLLTWTGVPEPRMTTLRVGLYHTEGNQIVNVDVLDDADNPVAPWVDIGLTNDTAVRFGTPMTVPSVLPIKRR